MGKNVEAETYAYFFLCEYDVIKYVFNITYIPVGFFLRGSSGGGVGIRSVNGIKDRCAYGLNPMSMTNNIQLLHHVKFLIKKIIIHFCKINQR